MKRAILTMILTAALSVLGYPALAVQYDNNGSAIQSSLYGKGTNPGDTAVGVDGNGFLKVNVATPSAVSLNYWVDAGQLSTTSVSQGLNYEPVQSYISKKVRITTLGAQALAGTTSITISNPAGLYPGSAILLERNNNFETVYVASTYTQGSTTVPITKGTIYTHSNGAEVDFDIFWGIAYSSSMTPYGILPIIRTYADPVGGYMYPERTANADGLSYTAMGITSLGLNNGSTLDRAPGDLTNGMYVNLRSTGGSAIQTDGQSAPTSVNLYSFPLGYNGSNWDRLTTGSAANLSANTGTGSLVVTAPGYWTSTATAAVNVVATTTKAAGGSGVRHVCTGIMASFKANTTAPAAALVTLVLRDGASVTGTILWQETMTLQAVAGDKDAINLTGLNIPGSAATAMTLEFTGAGGANTFENANLVGYDTK
jgi:hypothetical protein